MIGTFAGSGNLLQNPGFENALENWTASNVTVMDTTAAEGTQVARMGEGVASLSQAVPLSGRQLPLFLSYIAYTQVQIPSGNLIAQVLWLNAMHHVIGTGLRILSAANAITPVRITMFDITDIPPANAAYVKLVLSKNGTDDSELLLDQLLLTEVRSTNLVKNPGFERGLENWKATTFLPSFQSAFTNSGVATMKGTSGSLSQDVNIRLDDCSAYMLGFSAYGNNRSVTVGVKLIWLDEKGRQAGRVGIDTQIPRATLQIQFAYASYLLPTPTAPPEAVKARIIFTVQADEESEVRIDQVLLFRIATGNLVQNPDFQDDLKGWRYDGVNVVMDSGAPYIGTSLANFDSSGGMLTQTVRLPRFTPNNSYLFNFAMRKNISLDSGYFIAEVRWISALGNDLGLAASIYVPMETLSLVVWYVYAVATDFASPNATQARIQFTKAQGSLSIDNVVVAKLK